jgi:hypothetical protein
MNAVEPSLKVKTCLPLPASERRTLMSLSGSQEPGISRFVRVNGRSRHETDKSQGVVQFTTMISSDLVGTEVFPDFVLHFLNEFFK